MATNIDTSVAYPPTVPLSEELSRLEDLYAGRTIGSSRDVLDPDPDLADTATEIGKDRRKVRSNITADVADTIASLVVGEGITITTPNDTLTNTCAEVGLDNSVLTLAEMCSAYGGAYVRVTYQPDLNPVPDILITPPTAVIPVFRGNTLLSASCWQTVRNDSPSKVFRWIEHRDNQTKTISNELWQGTTSQWGKQVELDSIPETAGIPETQPYPAGVDRLVWYVPNRLPNRRHPDSVQGRSDFAGSESLITATDVVYTSLIRDFRLGRARIVVPVETLKRDTAYGATFDADREVYTTLDIDPSTDAAKPVLLQGAIRSSEHLASVTDIIARVVSSAGFSPLSFGIGEYGSATSGTALRVREGKTVATVNAKRRHLHPVVTDIVAVLGVLTGNPVARETISIEWADIHQVVGSDLAAMLNMLTAANVVSTETAVAMLHPEWSPEQVDEEVTRIRDTATAPEFPDTNITPNPDTDTE